MEDLGTLPGGTYSYAYDINNLGQVVGYSDTERGDGSHVEHTFLYDSTNGMKDPSEPPGPVFTWPWGENNRGLSINDSGQIVGSSETDYGYDHAFLYNIGTDPWKDFKDLGDLGYCCGEARGINTSGQVVGWSINSNQSYHAFLYSGEGPMQDLGDLTSDGSGYSRAEDINDSGQVVGYSENDTSGRAFLYQNEEMIDLNTRLIPDQNGSDFNLYWADGINNEGQIVVSGERDISLESAALLLTPSDMPPPDDTTPPQTTITSGPDGPTNDNTPTFEFTSDDSTASFECRLTKQGETPGSFESCTSPNTYPTQSDGTYTFEVRAKDEANNEDQSPAQQTFTVDTTPPETNIESGPSGIVNTDSATFEFSSSESGGGFTCSLDGAAYSTCTSPKQYTGLSEASHTFEVKANDSAGNTDSTPDSSTWTVDIPDDPVVPHVTDNNPNNGDTGVSRTIKPTVTFDTDLKADTVNPQNVKMQVYNAKKKRWVTVPSTPSYVNKVVTVTPASTLGSQKKYRVILNTNIKSSTDGALEQAYSFRFTTRR